MNQTLRRGLLLVALVVTGAAFDSLEEDDLACEEMAVTISECCAEVSPERFQCDFDDGCEGPATFTRGQMACLESLDCDEMERGGICEFFSGSAEETPVEGEAPRCLE